MTFGSRLVLARLRDWIEYWAGDGSPDDPLPGKPDELTDHEDAQLKRKASDLGAMIRRVDSRAGRA